MTFDDIKWHLILGCVCFAGAALMVYDGNKIGALLWSTLVVVVGAKRVRDTYRASKRRKSSL